MKADDYWTRLATPPETFYCHSAQTLFAGCRELAELAKCPKEKRAPVDTHRKKPGSGYNMLSYFYILDVNLFMKFILAPISL